MSERGRAASGAAQAGARLVAVSGALAALLGPGAARAHDFDPGVLSLVETTRGVYAYAYKEPVDASGASLGVRVRFPSSCAVRAPQQLDCGERGLHEPITFEGVRPRMRVVGLLRRLDGSAEERMVEGETPLEFAPSGVRAWVELGVEHLATGLDHVGFLVGLVLLVRTARGLVATITAFSVGHTLSLGLVAFDVVRPRSAPVEALIALSVLLVAREATHAQPTWTRRRPYVVGAFFGLVHGLAFGAALRALGLEAARVPRALLSFNVGVELGQLAVALPVFVLLRALDRRPDVAAVGRRALAYALGAMAAAWTLQRVAALLT